MGAVHQMGGGSAIVNPMAVNVLTLTVNDSHQVNIQSQLPPDATIKLLQSVITDVMIQYLSALAEKAAEKVNESKLTL